jgi:glutamine synthetase
MVSTLLLKDTSDRTAFKVFEPAAPPLPGFGFGNNLMLLADPASFRNCPGPGKPAGCVPALVPGRPAGAELDTRRVLQTRWRGWPQPATA